MEISEILKILEEKQIERKLLQRWIGTAVPADTCSVGKIELWGRQF